MAIHGPRHQLETGRYGSNQGRTGYQREPYLGSAERGAANYTADQLQEAIRYAHDHGWQVMVHANGDAAIDVALEAYEKALAGAEPTDLRHRIEHCSIAYDGHFRRMAAAGISPSFLMNHVYYWGKALRDNILGPGRANRLDAVASALRYGLRPSFHSDYSVSPICPLRSVQTAVTRSMRDGGEILTRMSGSAPKPHSVPSRSTRPGRPTPTTCSDRSSPASMPTSRSCRPIRGRLTPAPSATSPSSRPGSAAPSPGPQHDSPRDRLQSAEGRLAAVELLRGRSGNLPAGSGLDPRVARRLQVP